MDILKNELIDYRKGDCQEIIKTLPDKSIDVILTDPPYLYLKKQKLEREFDEQLFFYECMRVLKPGGFIVLFGRGTSFYRWNTMLAELGFNFKEEIVWDKSQNSSPLMALSRVHETISIHCKGKGKINKVKVPYLEMKAHDIDSIINDIKRIKSVLNNTKSLDAVLSYLEWNNLGFNQKQKVKHSVQVEGHTMDRDRSIKIISSIENGMNEKSIIKHYQERKHKNSVTVQPSYLVTEDRGAATVRIINDGMNEKSIIKQNREHYTSIHPTEKPVDLLKRLLSLVLPGVSKNGNYSTKPIVADFFAGSGSTGEACIEMDIPFFGCEIDDEYYNISKDRMDKAFRNRNRQISMF